MKTFFRDEPIVPSGDENVEELCKLAKRARGRSVNFDWDLTDQEVVNLRRAVHFWGKTVKSRFKKFDAEMLKAINEALDESSSAYSHSVPKGRERYDSSVSAIRTSDGVRITGHADFEVVLGYGYAAFRAQFPREDPWYEEIRSLLGFDLALKLQRYIDELGWHLDMLGSQEYRPAYNVIINLPKFYGIKAREIDPSTIDHKMTVEFEGPFHWRSQAEARSLFDDPLSEAAGIYLWTVPKNDSFQVTYVGQTGVSFRHRLLQHITKYASGEYTIVDAESLIRGERQVLWEGGLRASGGQLRLEDFLPRLPELSRALLELLDTYRFFLAPITLEERERIRLEGALGVYLRDKAEAEIRKYLTPGSAFSVLWPNEEPILSTYLSQGNIAGLPIELVA